MSIRSSFARMLATLLVGLAVAFVAQSAMAAVDRAQHSFGVAHAPTPLAGAVHHDADHQHGHEVDLSSDHADQPPADGQSSPTGHHHGAEIPHAATINLQRLAERLPMELENDVVQPTTGPRLRLMTRLERPPKSASKTL